MHVKAVSRKKHERNMVSPAMLRSMYDSYRPSGLKLAQATLDVADTDTAVVCVGFCR